MLAGTKAAVFGMEHLGTISVLSISGQLNLGFL
jgi:hypothetical protein